MDKPKLCPACQPLADASGLEWVQCGGLSVGQTRYPLVWRLRDKGETAQVKDKTKLLQQLAAAKRRIAELEQPKTESEP